MVSKNVFLIFNNVLRELYRCQTYGELGQFFLPMLKMLIPFRYASIMRREEGVSPVRLVDPLCVPTEFASAERNYMRFADDDFTGWLSCCRESTIFRESDLVGEQQRLRSTIYQKCYQPFHIYDSLQYGIVYNGTPLGALSLFRRREDGPFSDDELFLCTSVGTHLNQHMATLLDRKDRCSMWSGLEVRVPFCDYRIAEYLYGVPWEFKDYQGREKGLLRRAVEGLLPEQVLYRKKSPYPKTFDPRYAELISHRMQELLEKDAPLWQLVSKEAVKTFLHTDSPWPWYGQLMRKPQTMAYFLQLDFWLRHYRVEFCF